MSWFGDLLRRATLRGLTEATVQTVRAEALENEASDACERWQDYGFSALPSDGQGLVLNVAGHTIVLRMDRIAERPALQAMEVAVWHSEGHMVKLKAGKVVEISCDHLVVNAAADVVINSPTVSINASSGVALDTPSVSATGDVGAEGTVTGQADVIGAGTSLHGHVHPGVDRGPDSTDPPG